MMYTVIFWNKDGSFIERQMSSDEIFLSNNFEPYLVIKMDNKIYVLVGGDDRPTGPTKRTLIYEETSYKEF